MRIAIAQINSTLGDIDSNLKKIIEFIEKARQRKAQLVVFPEAALLGYHPFDLLERSEIVEDLQRAEKKIHNKLPKGLWVIFGTITKNPKAKGRPYFNSAVLLTKGKKAKYFHKQLLPTGDVFDEARFIESGSLENNYFDILGKKFFLTICEDIWAWPDKNGKSSYRQNPISELKAKPIDLVINLSASPWFPGKEKLRRNVTQLTARKFKAPILYANLVGAQDEIVFDGASFVLSPDGISLLKCEKFEEDLNVFDLETREAWSQAKSQKPIEDLRRALVLGIRDFCKKTGIESVHLGLSGGIDSAVVACLAVDALGSHAVTGFGLPGPFSAEESLNLAEKLAKNLDLDFHKLEITSTYDLAVNRLENSFGNLEFQLTHENLQSRIRGLYLMAFSNLKKSLLLTTGNKSEYATGYATLYGDMNGGLAPIGDLTKNQVYELAKLYNQDAELIPSRILSRDPSAELKPNQKDQDSLPPYAELDRAVVNIVENLKKPKTKTEKWLMKKLVITEFKRWQSAPILKVSSHSFGRGRRWPLAHRAFRKSEI